MLALPGCPITGHSGVRGAGCCSERWTACAIDWRRTSPTGTTVAAARSQQLDSYAAEQRKEPSLLALIEYLTERNLPEDPQESCSVAFKAVNFTIINDVL